MYFSDRAVIRRVRKKVGGEVDELNQPETENLPNLDVWCRAWPNREGHRESVEAVTLDSATVRLEGFSIGVPLGTDVQEKDRIVSLMVAGEEWLAGNPVRTLQVRGVVTHRRYLELQTQVIR